MAAKSTPANGQEVDAANGPQAVHRALEVLTLVVDSGPLTLSDIARTSGLPTSTTMRMLRALETWGYVFRSADGRYATGSRFVQSRVAGGGARPEDLIDLSASVMRRLTEETSESTYLAVPGPANTCTFLREVQSPLPIRHVRFDGWEGRTVPMAGSVVEEVLLGRIPESGFVMSAAVADPDSIVLGAPIHSAEGARIAVLEVTGPRFRMPAEVVSAHGEALKSAAAELSNLLAET
ncbi:IclR family transcriptional regulator [Leucobacter manosquensis]|uniref:IclR family transcriptional regulator n=1 Tax=Leucobacter manosquensis TaxID=2810611 RepID=UPI0024B4830C|nr:helix-turn-helix domain-containing protein [Leucobacter manosquensis]